MDKKEVILKFYRFLSLSIMTTDRKGRTIGIAVKAKAKGKKKKIKKLKKNWCSSTKMYGGGGRREMPRHSNWF